MPDCNCSDFPMIADSRIDKILCLDIESNAFEHWSKNRSLYTSLVGKLNDFSVACPDFSFFSSLSKLST